MAGVCASAIATPSGHVGAQDALTITGRIGQSLTVDDNPSSRDRSNGTEIRLGTELALAVAYETPTSRLQFTLDTDLDLVRDADGETDSDIADPRLGLSFYKEFPDSRLQFAIRQSSVEIANSFFLDLDGDLIPELIDSSIGDVDRITYSASFSYGINAPFGVDLSLRQSETDYSGTVDPELVDSVTRSARATARFRVNEVATVRSFVSAEETVKDFDPEQVETITSYGVGSVYEISPSLRFNGEIARNEATDELTGRVTTGVSIDAALTQDVPDGSFALSVARTIDPDEIRNTVRVDRSLSLPAAEVSYGVGLTDSDRGEPEVILSLDYARELPLAQLNAVASRSSALDLDDDPYSVLALEVDYLRELTPLTGLNLGLDLVRLDRSDADPRTNLKLEVGLSRELTPDWTWSVGYEARFDDVTGSNRSSNTIVTSIGRPFTIRP